MRGPSKTACASALAILAAALMGCGGSAAPERSPSAAAARWVDLPAVPGNGDSAAIGAAGGKLYVAVRQPGDRTGAQAVTSYVLDGGAWRETPSAEPVLTSAGAPLDVVDDGTGRPCLQAVTPRDGGKGARFRVFCLDGGRWQALADVPGASRSGASLGQLFSASGTLTTSVVRQASRSSRRSSARVLTFDRGAGAWRAAAATLGDARNSTARVRGLPGAGPCVVADRLANDTRLPEGGIGVICADDGAWRAEGRRFPVTAGTVAQLSDAARVGGTTFAGTVQLPLPSAGRDAFTFSWRVRRLTAGGWAPAALPALAAEWSTQGKLTAGAGRLWGARLALRALPDRSVGYAARLDVLRYQDGRFVRVGAPLLDGAEIYGPVQYGLAAVGPTLYAVWQRPDPARHANAVVVSRLDG